MKSFLKIVSISLIFSTIFYSFNTKHMNFYSFSAKDIDGNTVDFSKFKGKKVMVVNTASECGYTPQYKVLEEVYKANKNKNFVVIGFPCNQFGGQEPGAEKDIKSFCSKNYGVSFLMMSKIDVKGKTQHPLYSWLTKKAENGKLDSEVKWNFQKYLINENGELEEMLPSSESPASEKVLNWIN